MIQNGQAESFQDASSQTYVDSTVRNIDASRTGDNKKPQANSENIVILDEMNPDLSFSSYPTSENRRQLPKGSNENLQSNRQAILTGIT